MKTKSLIAGALVLGTLALCACSTQVPSSAPAAAPNAATQSTEPTTEGEIGRVTVRASGDLYLLPRDNFTPVLMRTGVRGVPGRVEKPLLGAVTFRNLKANLTNADGRLLTTEITLRQGDLEQIVDIEAWS